MAAPRPYKDGWRIQVQKDGRRVSKVFATKREAAKWALEIDSKRSIVFQKTFKQAITKYLETVSIHKRDAVEWERRRFDYLLDHFGDVPLSSLDSEKIGEWRDKRLKTVTGSTVMRELGLFRNLLLIALKEWKWIDSNPLDGVRLPSQNQPRHATWGWKQIKVILRAGEESGGKIGEVVRAFHISLRTAMRMQEALMAPEHLDRVGRVVVLPKSKTSARGEKVPLTRKGFDLIAKTQPFTVGPNEASVLFSKLCASKLIKGLQYRDSRATALTLMAKKVDILTLARISRHKNLDMIQKVYFRETAEQVSRRL
jgi:hypothetical protein